MVVKKAKPTIVNDIPDTDLSATICQGIVAKNYSKFQTQRSTKYKGMVSSIVTSSKRIGDAIIKIATIV